MSHFGMKRLNINFITDFDQKGARRVFKHIYRLNLNE